MRNHNVAKNKTINDPSNMKFRKRLYALLWFASCRMPAKRKSFFNNSNICILQSPTFLWVRTLRSFWSNANAMEIVMILHRETVFQMLLHKCGHLVFFFVIYCSNGEKVNWIQATRTTPFYSCEMWFVLCETPFATWFFSINKKHRHKLEGKIPPEHSYCMILDILLTIVFFT